MCVRSSELIERSSTDCLYRNEFIIAYRACRKLPCFSKHLWQFPSGIQLSCEICLLTRRVNSQLSKQDKTRKWKCLFALIWIFLNNYSKLTNSDFFCTLLRASYFAEIKNVLPDIVVGFIARCLVAWGSLYLLVIVFASTLLA